MTRVLDHEHPVEVAIKLGETPARWSEFNPVLYQAESRLQAAAEGAALTDSQVVAFGFRTVGRVGHHVAINGRPTFIRGTLDCVYFPLTGHFPCDVESWRRLFRVYKEYGLNQARFHSWCPPEAAFQAADEAGV